MTAGAWRVRTRARLVAAVVLASVGLAACSGDAKPSPGRAAAPATSLASTTTTSTEAPSTTAPPTTRPVKPKPAKPLRILRAGMHGADVAAVQRRLAGLGYEVTEADGEFGQATRH